MLLQSKLPHGGLVADLPGAGCSPVLRCLNNSHSCTVLSNMLRISFSSVIHLLDLSWIVKDLPCFSEVRSFTSRYALLLLFSSGKFQCPRTEHLSSPPAFTAFRILLLASLYSFALSASYRFFFKSLLSSQRSRTSLVTHGFFLRAFLPKYLTGCISHCCIVGGNHGIDVHVLITQSN